ncbi:leukocyte elastase inhibitor B-like isoform X2 [Ornithodoros turicata]|uniref:leukocyte elastase inhibitor B-like isoform X2 n=1 Tax=Ornithodoros turicata TaxID=34597 RepID=UPI003138A090
MEQGPETDSFNGMAVSLFRTLLTYSTTSNVLCSPLGIAAAIAASAVADSQHGAHLERLIQEVSVRLRQSCDSAISRCRLYVDKGNLQSENKSFLEKELATQMEPADFSKPQELVGVIGKWAEHLTRGAIRQVVPPSAVEGEHSCLVNVSSFSGDWDEAFVHSQTSVQPFYNEPGHSALVSTMIQTIDVHFVRLDAYQDGSHFVVFLPTLQGGLAEVLHLLTTWKDIKDAMERTVWTSDVTVMLPRMCLVSDTFDLGTALKGHHLESIVGARRVVHKAAMEVHEDGYRGPPTVSTMLSICTNLPANDPVHFAVDRPFLFAVIRTGIIYMMGVIRKLPQ